VTTFLDIAVTCSAEADELRLTWQFFQISDLEVDFLDHMGMGVRAMVGDIVKSGV
jgi:hypothetical protein